MKLARDSGGREKANSYKFAYSANDADARKCGKMPDSTNTRRGPAQRHDAEAMWASNSAGGACGRRMLSIHPPTTHDELVKVRLGWWHHQSSNPDVRCDASRKQGTPLSKCWAATMPKWASPVGEVGAASLLANGLSSSLSAEACGGWEKNLRRMRDALQGQVSSAAAGKKTC